MVAPFRHGKGIRREAVDKMYEKWKQEVIEQNRPPHGIRASGMIEVRGKVFHCTKCGLFDFTSTDLHYGPWECRECGSTYTKEQIETVMTGIGYE